MQHWICDDAVTWKTIVADTVSGNIQLDITKQDLTDLAFVEQMQCYQQTDESQNYYVKENSSIYQIFNESPPWVHELAKQLPQDFTHHVVSVTRLDPGNTVPYHKDLHYKLRTTHNLLGNTYRYLIFLEDWKPGHYFEIYGCPWVNWHAGDWIKFTNQDWHLAGNMGLEPFYSVQITVQ